MFNVGLVTATVEKRYLLTACSSSSLGQGNVVFCLVVYYIYDFIVILLIQGKAGSHTNFFRFCLHLLCNSLTILCIVRVLILYIDL